jgi:2-C-methyl-D-erythritol 4-phosphate cytidylyltransferase
MLIKDLSIVIPAAGLGERLGLGPKALLQLGDDSLLQWISRKALTVAAEVIVAAPHDNIDLWSQHCPGCRVIEGGPSFLTSMTKLIQAATQPWVMNLSVSMPFVSTNLMRSVGDAARHSGIAGAFLPMDMPVAQVKDGSVAAMYPRQACAVAQGPNAYRRDHLLAMIRCADAADWQRQSFLEIAMRHGYSINTVIGEKTNMKITNPEDWALAQHLRGLLN